MFPLCLSQVCPTHSSLLYALLNLVQTGVTVHVQQQKLHNMNGVEVEDSCKDNSWGVHAKC